MPQYYPALKKLVKTEKVPEPFKTALIRVIDKLFYKGYYVDKSVHGDTAFYNIVIVINKDVGFNLFGGEEGFEILINPGSTNGTTEIPVALYYNLPILKYIRAISTQQLDEPKNLFNIISGMLGVTSVNLLTACVYGLFNGDFTSFISHFNNNANYSSFAQLNTDYKGNYDEIIASIAIDLESNGVDIPTYVCDEVTIIENDVAASFLNVYSLFSIFLDNFESKDILKLLVPKFSVTIQELDIALAFPRSILKPIDNDIQKSILSYNVGSLGFHSEKGIEFNHDNTFDLTPSEIANTGLTLGITGLKLDFRTDKNIPEADADGRDFSFKGVFIESAAIGIPWIKDANGENLVLSGTNLLMGTPGGISGTIGLGSEVNGKLPGGIEVTINAFGIAIHQNQIGVGESNIDLTLKIPGLHDDNNQDAELNLQGSYFTEVDANGNVTETRLSVSISESDGLALKIPGVLDITVHELGLTQIDGGKVILSLKSDFYFTNKPGFIGDLLPEGIKVNPILFERGSGVKAFTIDLDWEKTEDTRLVYANDILDARIPLNKTILNFITLNGLRAIVENHPNGRDKQFQLLVDAGLKIGPVTGEAANFGLKADLNFRQTKLPEETEVPPLVSNLQFVPPSGIGIGIDAKAVKGGGFLLLDYNNNRYTGALNLAILEKFEVNAFGVLVTQLPSGQQGFSLIALISAQFNPAIQLGLGFTLNGLGGLLGLHRRANTELLRSELNSGRVEDLMFPVNPQARFAQIISNLEASFPIEENKFIFGPGAQIGWGTPSLITADIILLLEMPDPIRIIIMGVARSLLPDKNKAILKLQVAFLAVIDFANKSLSVDASIYDSKLLNFRLDGTMALRVLAGDNPYFLITVGGFHPQFRVPGFLNLPAQRRLAISMISGSALSIGAETYYAVSSNSVQFGAALWLKGQIAIIKAEGGFAFDALVMFNPFRFCVAVAAYITIKARLKLKVKIKIKLFKFKVQIKLEDVTLAGVDLRGQLCGPSYWNANATARFSLLGVGKSFDINREWGRKEEVTIPKIDLRALLLEALENDQNWKIEGGTAVDDLVTIRDISDEALILKGNGTLQVEQNTLPLNIEIQKFGNGVPLNDNRFQITRVVIGNQIRSLTASLRDTRDFFAPGEFRNLGDRRLSTRSFEKFPNGVVADPPSAAGALDYGQHKTERTMNFENKVIDAPSPTSNDVRRTTLQNVPLSTAVESAGFTLMAKGNAANRYNRKQKINRFTKTSKRIAVNEERFHIVDCRNLQNHSSVGTSVFSTEIEAKDALKQLTKTNPSLKKEITVVPSFEVAA